MYRELTFPLEAIAQRLSLHEGHHVEEEGVRLPGVEERQNVRMLEIRRRLDLGEKAFGADDRCQFGLQHLERHTPVVLQILGQVDGRHASFTELSLDAVTTCEGGIEPIDHV